ncbi:MAG: hypothetical protein ACXVGN_11915 [Mycobacteriaceae bacterium]
MAPPRPATPKADAMPATEPEPQVASGWASPGAALAALNPMHLARQIVPSRRTPVEHLAFYATIVGLALAEVIEPPIAALIVVGHRLHSSRNEAFREIGEGLDKVG